MNLKQLTEQFLKEEEALREGGGEAGKERQKRLGRLTVRERLNRLLDDPEDFLEFNIWAGYGMYKEHGELPAAGVVTGVGRVSGRRCMIIANDATVKAGAFFPQSVKKVLRAQRIAFESRLLFFTWLTRRESFCLCKKIFFRTMTILAVFSATTRYFRPPASRNSPRLWEIALPEVAICQCFAINF